MKIVHRETGKVLWEDSTISTLVGANLYGANLRGANLYGANLRGADLSSAYEKTADGLSIAVARCNYLAKRAQEKAGLDSVLVKEYI